MEHTPHPVKLFRFTLTHNDFDTLLPDITDVIRRHNSMKNPEILNDFKSKPGRKNVVCVAKVMSQGFEDDLRNLGLTLERLPDDFDFEDFKPENT